MEAGRADRHIIEADESGHLQHPASWNFHSIAVAGKTIVPLYVGKSSCVFKCVKMHLQWVGTKATSAAKRGKLTETHARNAIFKPTTACQFQAGFEYLFSRAKPEERANYLREYVGISISPSTPNAVADRFYLEDLLIGAFRSPFNLDSEH